MRTEKYSDPLLNFSGQVVLITGAASGFGAGLARELGARGARLVLGDINETDLATLAEQLRGDGVQVIAQRCDVASEADGEALVRAAVERFGRLDIAVNNAGIAPPMMKLDQVDEAVLDRQLAVNLKGVFFGMKHQLKAMQAQGGGNILNVSSMAGLGGAPKAGAYAAAKHAVVGLTRTAAVEYARHQIRVNAICPFFTLTPLVTNLLPDDAQGAEAFQDFLATGCPLKRLAQPQEVVNAMVMLCSPSLSYVTGQALAVDGGVSAF